MARARHDADPAYLRLLEILEDDEWHDAEELMSLVAATIPPGIAFREMEEERRRRLRLPRGEPLPPRTRGNDHTTILSGQRRVVRNALNRLYRYGRADVDWDERGGRRTIARLRIRREGGAPPKIIPPGAPHGVYATYTNYQCRCDLCKAARLAYDREYRKHKRERRELNHDQ